MIPLPLVGRGRGGVQPSQRPHPVFASLRHPSPQGGGKETPAHLPPERRWPDQIRPWRRGFRGWLVADELLHKDLVLLAVLPHPFLHLDVMTVILINRR